jgi:hypothetical protein
MNACKNEILLLVCILSLSFPAYSQSENIIDISDTTLTKKEIRKSDRVKERKLLKPHVFISAMATYAKLHSQVSFEHSSNLFRAQIDLEDHLGLESTQWFFSYSLIYRITPSSGVFSMYYGLHRANQTTLEEDVVFEGDTLKAGTLISPYFNTNVFSLGYLLSILKEEKAFLGVYFNVYVMKINTGISSEVFEFDEKVDFFAPLPNFGLAMAFELQPWLNFSGNIGLFFANIEGYTGAIHDISASLSFSPTPWLGLNVGFNVFDVLLEIPDDDFKTIIEYNFSGPSLGLTLRF